MSEHVAQADELDASVRREAAGPRGETSSGEAEELGLPLRPDPSPAPSAGRLAGGRRPGGRPSGGEYTLTYNTVKYNRLVATGSCCGPAAKPANAAGNPQDADGIVENVMARWVDLQASEGVVVEVHLDVLRQERVDPFDFLEDLLRDVAVQDVALLGGAELDEVMDLAEIPGELGIGGYAASRV